MTAEVKIIKENEYNSEVEEAFMKTVEVINWEHNIEDKMYYIRYRKTNQHHTNNDNTE